MDSEILLKNLKHLLPLIYIIPTYCLYFFILYVMFLSPAKAKFSGSFYQFFGLSAINCVIQSIFYFAVLRFLFTPSFFHLVKDCPRSSWIYPAMYMIMYYSAVAMHFYSLFISFNRFTVFILLTKYKTFWKEYLKYFVVFAIFVPVLFVWHFPFISVQCFFSPEYGSFILPVNYASFQWMDVTRNLFIQILITSLLSLSMNLYVMFQLFKRRYYNKNNKTPTNNHHAKHVTSQDMAMFIYSLLIFFIEFCGCVQQLLLTFWPTTFLIAISSTQWILADVGTLAPAFFILATNKLLREEVLNVLDCGGSNAIQSIPVISISSNTRAI